jgi:hypothetical protein
MDEQTRGSDPLHGLFKDFAEVMAEAGLPPGLFSPEIVQRSLQVNRALLQRYQNVLAEGGDESLAQQQKELTKALMLCCLDLGKAFRVYRESVVSAQSALIARYLELLEAPEGTGANKT